MSRRRAVLAALAATAAVLLVTAGPVSAIPPEVRLSEPTGDAPITSPSVRVAGEVHLTDELDRITRTITDVTVKVTGPNFELSRSDCWTLVDQYNATFDCDFALERNGLYSVSVLATGQDLLGHTETSEPARRSFSVGRVLTTAPTVPRGSGAGITVPVPGGGAPPSAGSGGPSPGGARGGVGASGGNPSASFALPAPEFLPPGGGVTDVPPSASAGDELAGGTESVDPAVLDSSGSTDNQRALLVSLAAGLLLCVLALHLRQFNRSVLSAPPPAAYLPMAEPADDERNGHGGRREGHAVDDPGADTRVLAGAGRSGRRS